MDKGKSVLPNELTLLEKKDQEIKRLQKALIASTKQFYAIQNDAIRNFTEAIRYNENILYNVVSNHDIIPSRESNGYASLRNQLVASQAILADARDAILNYQPVDDQFIADDDKDSIKSITTVNNFKVVEPPKPPIPSQAFVDSLKELSEKLCQHQIDTHSTDIKSRDTSEIFGGSKWCDKLREDLCVGKAITQEPKGTPQIKIPAVYIGVFKIDIPPAVIKKSLSDMFGDVIAVAKYRHRDHAFAYFSEWESYNEALNQGGIVISGQMLSIRKSDHAPRPGSFDWYRFRSAYMNVSENKDMTK
ncbi:27076_t:CDS:2 [Dentiscutata erythropus]|uniref:27076_t:CDS:1 n=1 Tax=Dentiscutata erythropus TaxID=1348616 RepID=A0A9N9A918_9GLOM|nr:27076_t:CDS:2 [Dentiscutata erythropus]